MVRLLDLFARSGVVPEHGLKLPCVVVRLVCLPSFPDNIPSQDDQD